jgi:hypothetical protein
MTTEIIGKFTETIGKYQLHLFALQLSGNGQWVPYLTIHRFDDASENFDCILEKQRVSDNNVFASEAQAIEEARRAGNAWIAEHGASFAGGRHDQGQQASDG